MKFSDFVCFDAVIPELKAKDRNSAITELVSAMHKAGCLGRAKCQEITNAIIKRETEASTGMGKGVAVPHVKHQAVRNVVATVGRSSSGIDFISLDRQPVYSIFLLISPLNDPDKHLEAMEKIFRHLQNDRFRKFLRQSQNIEEIKDLLKEADENTLL